MLIRRFEISEEESQMITNAVVKKNSAETTQNKTLMPHTAAYEQAESIRKEHKQENSKEKSARRLATNKKIHEIIEKIGDKKSHLHEINVRSVDGYPNYCESHDCAVILLSEFNYNIKKLKNVYEISIQIPGKSQAVTGYHRHMAYAMCEMFIRLYSGEFDDHSQIKKIDTDHDDNIIDVKQIEILLPEDKTL